MVFSKYLFAIVTGLTGAINIWAFSNSGKIIGKNIEGFNNNLDSISTNNDVLISKESSRLEREKKISEEKFKELDDSNNSTKKQSESRKLIGDQLLRSNLDLTVERNQQSLKLGETSKKLSESLKESTTKFKQELENKVKEYHSQLQESVKAETKKLSKALEDLKSSNTKLIADVKRNIEEMPYKLFEFDSEGKTPRK